MQEFWTLLAVGAAVGYLVVRWRKRKLSGNCCGEPECPAATHTVRELERLKNE